MDDQAQGAAIGLAYPSAPMQEKYFEEKDDKEKIHTLSESFEYAVKEIRVLRKELEALKSHAHGSSGELLVPFANLLKDAREESYWFKNPLRREKPFWKF